MLKPAKQYQQRKASIEELDQLIAKAWHPRFIEIADEFKAKLSEGDELWEFCTDEHSWDHMAGRAGYIITRNGQTVAELVTLLN
jgi:hypothetical protein